MKKVILMSSAGSALLASAIAIGAVLMLQPNEVSGLATVKANMVAGYLGLLSISLFFVGLAFPKNQ